LQDYYVNSTYGWSEGSVVSIDLFTGNVVSSTSFMWSHFISLIPVDDPSSINGSCVTMANGQFSFFDSEQSLLYTISSPFIAQINVSTGTPVFVDKWSLGNNMLFQGFAYNSKERVVYAVSDTNLTQFAIDEHMNQTVINSNFNSLSYSAMATIDPTNKFYIVLQVLGGGQYVYFYSSFANSLDMK
jgi:hypothetical protein